MRTVLAGTLVALLVASSAPAAPPAVGLVTRLGGKATWARDGGAVAPARAFMKVRAGDRFEVPAGGVARIVWFAAGRQETWSGPVAFDVGDASGKAVKPADATPTVASVPARAAPGLRRVPALLKRIGSSRAGGVQVRAGGGAATRKVVPLAPDEQAELQAARDLAAAMRAGAAPDDVVADLLLIDALADFEQYPELARVVEAALARQPDNEELKRLAGWVAGRLPRP